MKNARALSLANFEKVVRSDAYNLFVWVSSDRRKLFSKNREKGVDI